MSRRNKKKNRTHDANINKAFNLNDFFKMFGVAIQHEENERISDTETNDMFVFADAIVHSRLTFKFDDLAMVLRNNGFPISKGRLLLWMHEHQYLYKCEEYDNMPFAKYVEQGLFELNQYVSSEDGDIKLRFSAKITGKGMKHFINIFLKEKNHNK